MSSSPELAHQSQAAADLRHMTSQHGLTARESARNSSNRISQHLQTGQARIGSRSPNSIPSSPTSVHSSSSAIFERDIEPITTPSPPHSAAHPPNPHFIARSKGTESLELSVPSVLDSAAAILATVDDVTDQNQIAVVAPALDSRSRGIGSGWASPIGSFRSRSPSPIGSRTSNSNNRASLLLSIPGANSASSPRHQTTGSPPIPATSAGISSAGSSPKSNNAAIAPATRPSIQTLTLPTSSQSEVTPAAAPGGDHSPPSLVTPTSAYFSAASNSSGGSSPTTTTTRDHPLHTLSSSPSPSVPAVQPTIAASQSSPIAQPPLSATSLASSHPPSPNVVTKRLSFMSYSDLLSSTPASMLPLSSLTSCASSVEPPPHIPTVSGFTAAASHGPSHGNNRDSIFMQDDVGGEWEREGLGKGLEERLEALMPVQSRA